MIVNRITGGLGNQMFEYAFGHYLARKHKTEHVLDVSPFDQDMLREFVLDRFNISARIATRGELRNFSRRSGLRGRLGRLAGRPPLAVVKEAVYGFKPEYMDAGPDTYLDGFWQSEKHFPGMIVELQHEFQPVVDMSDETFDVARQMASTESACIHVRRTDYLQVWYTTVCSQTYYERSVEYLLSRHEGLRLFVFSDDIAWCQQALRFPCPTTFVDHNDCSTGHEDLWLMTQCRHHVVANSTFSWWGARLGFDSTGETLAPDPWLSHSDVDSSHIVPPGWIKISGNPTVDAVAA
jgi:hypothetical protein